ncbi:MAG: Hsp20 family protein, partial [bacterium]
MRYLPGFSNVFDDLFDDRFFAPTSTVNSMLCDIKDLGSQYEMNMALPGYKKEDIQLKLDKGYLTVTASRSTEKEDKEITKAGYHKKMPKEDTDNLESLSITKLKEIAKEKGIK